MRARHAALIAALPMILTAACLPSGLPEPSGREDFADYCAACHGIDGSGQGAVASVLDASPADLTMLAGHLLVPVTSGYDTFDAQSGAGQTHIALARQPVNTAVIPALAGSVLLEQRGSQLVALGQ